MPERMHKTETEVSGCPQGVRTESERYVACIWMVEDNVVEVPFDREHLLEAILSPDNLNKAYKSQFCRNSFGFRSKRGCHDALRRAKDIVNSGYKYVIALDLERFFDTVCHIV